MDFSPKAKNKNLLIFHRFNKSKSENCAKKKIMSFGNQ